MEPMDRIEKRYLCILFLVLLFIGLIAVQGYGIGVDENPEIDIARMDLKEYLRIFPGEESNFFRYVDGKIGDLMDSVEIDHGEALLYPVVAIVSVLREMGRADLGMLAYHIYLYWWFLIGIAALYRVGKYLTGKTYWGICAAAFVWMNPLLFGDSFTNNKDMILMSLVSICFYTGIQFIEKKNWKWSVLWGINVAFCVNMRIVGLAYVGLFGLLYLIEYVRDYRKERKVFLNGVLAIIVTVFTFIMITPATWYSLIGYFRYTLLNTVGFTRWNQLIFYIGKVYHYPENPLPWHYFLVWIGITTPLVILLSFILGQFYMLREVICRKIYKSKKKYLLICLALVWTPMLFYMIKGANVYGKWRHFYFIYPELVLIAICGLDWFCGLHKKVHHLVKVLLLLQACVCIGLLYLGHPFQSYYFNCLVERPVGVEFEYASTIGYKEALEIILKRETRDDILISSDHITCYYGIKQAWEVLSPEKKERIQIAEPETEGCINADYHVYDECNLRQEKWFAENGMTEDTKYVPEKKFDRQIVLRAYGNPIITIYYHD